MRRTERTEPQRRRFALSRRWIAAVALLYLASVLAASFHESFHAHRVCEHGEFVHVDESALEACGHASHDGASSFARDAAPRAPDAPGHGHAHCAIAVSVAHEERRAPDLVGTALLVARAPQRVHASERAPASWPLFLLAPHHSPPAV